MTIAIIAALAALSVSAPVTHHNADEQLPTEAVSVAHLDLTTAHGVRMAHRRLSWAVLAVCQNDDPRGMLPSARVEQCRKNAWAQADEQLNVAVADADAQRGVALAAR